MSLRNQGSPPSWEVLLLVGNHLDPRTLAVASCVSKSWSYAMSLDLLWKPLCTAHFPSISALKITNTSISYRRLYSIGNASAKQRSRLPPKPRISIDSLIFFIHLSAKNGGETIATVAKPANEAIADANGMFKFDIDVEKGHSKAVEEVRVTWNVVMRGWEGVFTMMDLEGKLKVVSSLAGEIGWFSEELPSPRCCFWGGGSGVVADFKLGFGRGGSGGGGGIEVEKVSVGMLSTVSWRYLGMEDGLKYLQHFLLPYDACCHGKTM